MLSAALRWNRSLKKLKLNYCGIRDDGAVVMASALRINDGSLASLELYGEGTPLCRGKGLIRLHPQRTVCTGNKISNVGGLALTEALRWHRSQLTRLALEGGAPAGYRPVVPIFGATRI